MQLRKQDRIGGKQSAMFSFFILLGILIGVFLLLFCGKSVGEKVYSYTEALVVNIFSYQVGVCEMFMTILWKRLCIVTVCFLAITKCKAKWPTCIVLFWYCVCIGFVLAGLSLADGVEGLKLGIYLVFPQCVLYFIVFKNILVDKGKEQNTYYVTSNKEFVRHYLTLFLVVVMSVLVECYVNSYVIKTFFKFY